MDALILCAGLGKRLLPYTNYLPKPMMPIHGRPLLEYWLQILRNARVNRVFVNVYHLPDSIIDLISDIKCNHDFEIIILREEILLGAAGTIRHFKSCFTEDLLVIHGDNFGITDLGPFIGSHRKSLTNSENIFSLLTFNSTYPSKCGIFELDEDSNIISFEEKPALPKSNIASGAIFILQQTHLRQICEGQLKDLSTEFIPRNLRYANLWHFEKFYMDIGDIHNLCVANATAQVIDTNLASDRWLSNYQKYCKIVFNECSIIMEGIDE